MNKSFSASIQMARVIEAIPELIDDPNGTGMVMRIRLRRNGTIYDCFCHELEFPLGLLGSIFRHKMLATMFVLVDGKRHAKIVPWHYQPAAIQSTIARHLMRESASVDRLNAEAVRLISEKSDPRIDFLEKMYMLDSANPIEEGDSDAV